MNGTDYYNDLLDRNSGLKLASTNNLRLYELRCRTTESREE